MNLEKITVYGVVFILMSEFLRAFLTFFGVVRIENKADILFALIFIFFLGIIAKHRYWIIACIFLGISELFKISIINAFNMSDSVILEPEYSIFTILIIVISLICLVVSSIYFYKFFKLKEFSMFFRYRKR